MAVNILGPRLSFHWKPFCTAARRSAAPDAAGRSESRSRCVAEWARSVRFCSHATKDLLLFLAFVAGSGQGEGSATSREAGAFFKASGGNVWLGVQGKGGAVVERMQPPQPYSVEENADGGPGGDDERRKASPANVCVCV